MVLRGPAWRGREGRVLAMRRGRSVASHTNRATATGRFRCRRGMPAPKAARQRAGREAAPRVPSMDPSGIENLIVDMALRARITQEPAARLPYLALARDQRG